VHQPIDYKLASGESRLSRQLTAEVIVAKAVSEITLGIDVSKHELVIHHWERGDTFTLSNDAGTIQHWLSGLYGRVRLAIEPTSNYHFELVDQAHALDHAVFLVNPRQLVHYRESVNLRHKTDPDDAWLLARYLSKESQELRPFRPLCRRAQALWSLIKRRATVVEARKQLRQSLRDVACPHQGLMTEFQRLLSRIDRRIKALITALGWQPDFARCQSIPGIGPINAAALVCTFHRGSFAGSDAFVAYLGLDVRRRESGLYKGKRKLTKRGESELRRLLYCAAKPARCHPRFEAYYQAQLDNGHSKIAANVILGRKLARLAFTLLTRKEVFNTQTA
jgi:transposase